MFVKLLESLKQTIKDETGYEFELQDVVDEKTGISYKKLVKKNDIKFSERKKIDQEKVLRDSNPISIDYIEIWPDKVLIGTSGEFSIFSMTEKYYGLEIILDSEDALYMNREDKMKLARYVPALIKDVEVAIKIMAEVSTRNGFDPSEFKLFQQDDVGFCVKSEYSTVGISEEKIVENCMKRVKVISEWRKRFRTWLSSSERIQFYESTKIIHEAPVRARKNWYLEAVYGLIKWPIKDTKTREKLVKDKIWEYLYHGANLFTLDGYGIAGYIDGKCRLRFWVDDKEKKYKKLRPIPLEKIEFLKEDFPELWEK